MLITNIIALVRNKLRDQGVSDTSVPMRNTFWSDDEILLAIKMAQLMLVRHAVEQKSTTLLNSLLIERSFDVFSLSYPMVINTDPIPDTFYSPAAVAVTEDNIRYPASLEMGTVAMHYAVNNMEYEVGIINTDYYCDKPIRLWYYRIPYDINEDVISWFPEDVITNIIVETTSYLLGMKNPQTQREYKTAKNTKEAMGAITGKQSTANRTYNIAVDLLTALMSMAQ